MLRAEGACIVQRGGTVRVAEAAHVLCSLGVQQAVVGTCKHRAHSTHTRAADEENVRHLGVSAHAASRTQEPGRSAQLRPGADAHGPIRGARARRTYRRGSSRRGGPAAAPRTLGPACATAPPRRPRAWTTGRARWRGSRARRSQPGSRSGWRCTRKTQPCAPSPTPDAGAAHVTGRTARGGGSSCSPRQC